MLTFLESNVNVHTTEIFVLDKRLYWWYDNPNLQGGHDDAAFCSGQYRSLVRSALVARKRACIVMRFLKITSTQKPTV